MSTPGNQPRKTIGILGGMGPEATVHLFALIVRKTRAEKDADHIPVVITNHPQIPDRTEAIQGRGESPLPHLIKSAQTLEQAGADFIAMPCVTAHYFYPAIISAIHIPVIHLIRETLNHILETLPGISRYGLLATAGTLKTGLFQREMEQKKIRIIVPDPEAEKIVMDAVYGPRGIKAGFKDDPRKKISATAARLKEQGAAAIIAGCTEIALVADQIQAGVPVINPLRILAGICIRRAGFLEKPEVKKIRS